MEQMSPTILARWVVIIACAIGMCGCSRESPPQQQETLKTAEEYKAEADEQINEENASAELGKLEQSINEEAATAQ